MNQSTFCLSTNDDAGFDLLVELRIESSVFS